MAKYKKVIFLFLALFFPVCIFLFLKFFGKNEFDVPALYNDAYPENISDCGIAIALPYRIPDSVQSALVLSQERMTLIHFGTMSPNEEKIVDRIKQEHGGKVLVKYLSDTLTRTKECVFFLKEPNDLVLVDRQGAIRGQYESANREEIDRLRMELSILFEEY